VFLVDKIWGDRLIFWHCFKRKLAALLNFNKYTKIGRDFKNLGWIHQGKRIKIYISCYLSFAYADPL
jgi:hypothetical protein